ncbi:MAG: hypothetical protein ACREB2_06840 [Pseudolabrys sp.]
MRVIAVAALTIALLAWGVVSQSAPRTPEQQTGASVNPMALQKAIDMKTLPEQKIGELF